MRGILSVLLGGFGLAFLLVFGLELGAEESGPQQSGPQQQLAVVQEELESRANDLAEGSVRDLPTASLGANDLAEGLVRHVRKASLGANVSLASNDNVVGQTDGSSQTYGLSAEASFRRLTERSEWRRDMSLVGATSRTPSLPRFVKSKDELSLSSIYLYSLERNPKLGPFVKASAKAPVFKGEEVRSDVTSFRFVERDGSTRLVEAESLRLTDPLKPLNLSGSTGVFYRPVHEPNLKIESRLGVGGLYISAEGQYAVKDKNDAGEVVVEALSSVEQLGIEAALGVEGRLSPTSSYELSLVALTPLVNNVRDEDSRSNWELTNIEGSFKLTSQVTEWAALTYDYQLKLQPQLVSGPQQTHLLLLNLTYSLFE